MLDRRRFVQIYNARIASYIRSGIWISIRDMGLRSAAGNLRLRHRTLAPPHGAADVLNHFCGTRKLLDWLDRASPKGNIGENALYPPPPPLQMKKFLCIQTLLDTLVTLFFGNYWR